MNRSGVFLWQLVGSGFRRIYCRRNDNRNSIIINDALTWWQKIRRFLLRAKFRNTDNLDAIMKYKHVEQDMRLLAEAYPLICFVSGRGFHKQVLRKKLSATKFQILQKWATYISKSLQQMERWEIVIPGWENFRENYKKIGGNEAVVVKVWRADLNISRQQIVQVVDLLELSSSRNSWLE